MRLIEPRGLAPNSTQFSIVRHVGLGPETRTSLPRARRADALGRTIFEILHRQPADVLRGLRDGVKGLRLAFAVAAHLDPEILIVDEVLAVGDANFQRKCLNKMQDVSTGGRTVLFVSHNMGAVSRLCQRTILLNEGRVVTMGSTQEVIQTYTVSNTLGRGEFLQPPAPEKTMHLRRAAILKDGELRAEVGYHENFSIRVEYEINRPITGGNIGIGLFAADGGCILQTADFDAHPELLELREPGYYHADIDLPSHWLSSGRYVVRVYISSGGGTVVYDNEETLVFTIVDTGTPGSRFGVRRPGVLQPLLEWKTERTESVSS